MGYPRGRAARPPRPFPRAAGRFLRAVPGRLRGVRQTPAPRDALSVTKGSRLQMDLGRCIFCGDCTAACPSHVLSFSRDYRLAVGSERTWCWGPGQERPPARGSARRRPAAAPGQVASAAAGERGRLQRLRGGRERPHHRGVGHGAVRDPVRRFAAARGRPAGHRAGDDEHANGAGKDLGRGARSEDRDRLRRLRDLRRHLPRIARWPATALRDILPVDLFVPGCPPHPLTLLDGLLRLLGRISD